MVAFSDRIEEYRKRVYHKESRFAAPATLREEYRALIHEIGAGFRNKRLANHKGIREVAEALGIAYETLKGRINNRKHKAITREMVLAALWVRHHQYVPGKPMLYTPREMVVAVVEGSHPLPLTPAQMQSGIIEHYGEYVARQSIMNVLDAEMEEDEPRVKRHGKKGFYVAMHWKETEMPEDTVTRKVSVAEEIIEIKTLLDSIDLGVLGRRDGAIANVAMNKLTTLASDAEKILATKQTG